jgi:hypothetical protein
MARSSGRGWDGTRGPGYPGKASAAQVRTSGLPGLPVCPVRCGLLAGGWAGGAIAGRAALGVLAPVQPARMAQVSVAEVSVKNNG